MVENEDTGRAVDERVERLEREASRSSRRNARLRREPRPELWFGLYLLVVSALAFLVVAWPLVLAFAIGAPLAWWRSRGLRRRLADRRAERRLEGGARTGGTL